MLSYRHAFHAGNHADVLKHLTQTLSLDYLIQKDKPLVYVDTHAGPGIYSLTSGFSQQKSEYETGISKLWSAPSLCPPLTRYRALVASLNQGSQCHLYPGSPAIARAILRPQDRLQLFELHPQDMRALEKWAADDRRLRVSESSGFDGLIAMVPPIEKRALVVIDPPYEVKKDYQTAFKSLQGAISRFATGTYILWYPLLQRAEVEHLRKQVMGQGWKCLQAELKVCKPEAWGMYGSGVVVINPPWTLKADLEQALPQLVKLLGQDSEAGFVLHAENL